MRQNEEGLASVEFVAMLPIFILILSLLFTACQLYITVFVSNFAVYDGARTAMALDSTPEEGKSRALSTLQSTPFKFQSATISCSKNTSNTSCSSQIEIPLILKVVGFPKTVTRTVTLPTEKPI